jgi:hypothetical protein
MTSVGHKDNNSTSTIMTSMKIMTDIGGSPQVKSVTTPRKRSQDPNRIPQANLTSRTRVLQQNTTFLTSMEETTTKEQPQMATPLLNSIPHDNLGNSPPRLRNYREKGKGRGPPRSRLFSFPDLNDPITLRPGQHVIVEGQHFILRGQPQITVTQTTQYILRSQTEGDAYDNPWTSLPHIRS